MWRRDIANIADNRTVSDISNLQGGFNVNQTGNLVEERVSQIKKENIYTYK